MSRRFDWNVSGEQEAPPPWASISLDEILYEYDGPRTFTVRDGDWQFLWHLCDVAEEAQRFVVVPTNEEILSRLKEGVVTVLEALSAPGCRVVELGCDDKVIASWRVALSSLPESVLPKRGTMLLPSLAPYT